MKPYVWLSALGVLALTAGWWLLRKPAPPNSWPRIARPPAPSPSPSPTPPPPQALAEHPCDAQSAQELWAQLSSEKLELTRMARNDYFTAPGQRMLVLRQSRQGANGSVLTRASWLEMSSTLESAPEDVYTNAAFGEPAELLSAAGPAWSNGISLNAEPAITEDVYTWAPNNSVSLHNNVAVELQATLSLRDGKKQRVICLANQACRCDNSP